MTHDHTRIECAAAGQALFQEFIAAAVGHQPEAIAGFDLAMPGDYRLMQGEGASEQFAAALVKTGLVTAAGLAAALAPPPDDGGAQRKQREQNVLRRPGQFGKQVAEQANAGHLFAGKQIVSMAYQWDQMGILWVVMSDGTLLSCAYSPEEDVIAWARHDTQGRFESVGVLRDEDGTDQIYFSVARDDSNGQTHRFIESLENIITESAAIEDMFFVDSGLSYAGEPTLSVSGMDHLEGFSVVALADGNVIDNLTVTGGKVTLPGKQKFSLIHVGLPYQAEVQTLELEPAEGGTLRNRRRWTVNASIRFWRSRQCLFAVNDSQKRQTMKFRTEPYDKPIQPYTGEKSASFYSTGNADQARVYLTCVDPVPFGVLGIIGEVSYGQAT